jgi:hypothetical protein
MDSTRAWLFLPYIVRVLVPTGMPGVYMLGRVTDERGSFIPYYVGRSDSDIRRRLSNHEKLPSTTHFCVQLCGSAEEAFMWECFYWHALRDEATLMNNIHPDSPVKAGLICPYCSASKQFREYISGHAA